MKKVLSLSAILFLGYFVVSFSVPENVPIQAFKSGEKLTYSVKYSLYLNIPVATMELKLSDELKEFNGQECLHFSATGKTYRFYDNFFPIRDYFNAYIDPVSFKPRLFTRNVSEGDYSKKDYTIFYPEKNYAKNRKGKTFEIPTDTWDILSVWYLARNFDYEKMEKGDSINMHTFIDDKTYPIGLKYQGKETIKTSLGKVECYVIEPLLIAGEIFKTEEEMILYVSADENKVPVVIESGISVGKVRAELTEYLNLKNDFAALEAK